MLYTRHNFEVAAFCDTLGVRPQLAGILVTPNGTAATDSYVLLEFPVLLRIKRRRTFQ
jgi:hypothetical protein